MHAEPALQLPLHPKIPFDNLPCGGITSHPVSCTGDLVGILTSLSKIYTEEQQTLRNQRLLTSGKESFLIS